MHMAPGFKMHRNNENGFCYKTRFQQIHTELGFQQIHTELAAKFIQIRRPSETSL